MKSLAVLAIAVLAASTAANGQGVARGDDDGAVKSFLSAFSDPRGEFNVRKHAFCVAQKYPLDAQMALHTDADMQDIMAKYRNLLDFKCTSGAMFKDNSTSLSDAVFQPALAEALLVNHYDGKSFPDVAHVAIVRKDTVPEMDLSKFSEKLRKSLEVAKFFSDLDLISECIARAAPKSVFALMETKPGSEQEVTAFQGLERPMADCNFAKLPVVPSHFILRGAFAKNLYLLVDAARTVSHDKGNAGA